MRLPRSNRRGPVAFNMTPLIDVVFLLIVFFLVSSNLARQETQLPLDLPRAATSDKPQEEREPRRRIVINLPAEGQLLIGAQAIEVGRLETILRHEHRTADRPLEVRIRTDRTVPYRAVEPVLVACAKAGVWDVSFSVLNKP